MNTKRSSGDLVNVASTVALPGAIDVNSNMIAGVISPPFDVIEETTAVVVEPPMTHRPSLAASVIVLPASRSGEVRVGADGPVSASGPSAEGGLS
jgi:hypothetical protein